MLMSSLHCWQYTRYSDKTVWPSVTTCWCKRNNCMHILTSQQADYITNKCHNRHRQRCYSRCWNISAYLERARISPKLICTKLLSLILYLTSSRKISQVLVLHDTSYESYDSIRSCVWSSNQTGIIKINNKKQRNPKINISPKPHPLLAAHSYGVSTKTQVE